MAVCRVLAQLQQNPPDVLVLHGFWVAFHVDSPVAMVTNDEVKTITG